MRFAIFFLDLLHYHVARCAALINLAATANHEVFVYSIRPKSPELPTWGYQHLLGEKVQILTSDEHVSLNSLSTANVLQDALNQHKPDAVAIPGYRTRVCRTALKWCKRNSRAAILMSESRREDFARVWWKEYLKRSLISQFDAAVVGGKLQAQYAAELGIPHDCIFLGYDAVDNRFWIEQTNSVRSKAIEYRRSTNLPEYYFLAVGRFIAKKNFNSLIRSYHLYRQAVSAAAWDLVICGTGPLEAQLRQLVSDLGHEGAVHFMGYLGAEQLAVAYGLASAFVFPSAYAEQWGLVVNEAMAAGLPVLVSRTVGCAQDLVHDGVNGSAFDPYSLEELAQLMTQISAPEASNKRAAMGEASRAIISEWSPTRFATSILNAANAGLPRVSRNTEPWWTNILMLF